MNIDTEVDSRSVEVALRDVRVKELPYVMAIMLTKLAGDGRDRFRGRLPVVFDRPTEFTVRGVAITPANRVTQEAEVFVPDSEERGGLAKREFLRPELLGSYGRQQKKTEWLLSRLGVLPAGWVTTPGKGAKLDGYGNISGRIYAQIINVLQLKARVVGGRTIAERSQKRAQRLGVEAEFFAIPPGANKLAKGGGWLPPGVWQHLKGRRISQILKFVRKAGYKARVNLNEEVQETVNELAQQRWDEASVTIRAKFSQGR